MQVAAKSFSRIRLSAISISRSLCVSHAELDGSQVLDEGNQEEFGRQIVALKHHSPQLNVLGGCCGKDILDIQDICQNIAG